MSIDVADIHAAAPCPLELARLLGLSVAPGARPDRVRVSCPWHNEKTPSCVVALKDGRVVAHCFACQAGGDLLSLVAVTSGLDLRSDFRSVVARAGDLLGVRDTWRDTGSPAPAPRRPAELAQLIDASADDWIAGRAVQALPDCSPQTVRDAFSDLHELDAMRSERHAKLTRVANAYERHHGHFRNQRRNHPELTPRANG